MTGLILGVDPGGTAGGWALLDELGQIVSAGDLPVVDRMVSAPLLAAIIERFTPARAVVERVGPMPRQGIASTYRFGRGVGVIEGILGTESVPVAYVAPAVWKRHFRLGADKELARQRAIEIWPASAELHFARRRDHGRAEASLIALWGQRSALAAGEAASREAGL